MVRNHVKTVDADHDVCDGFLQDKIERIALEEDSLQFRCARSVQRDSSLQHGCGQIDLDHRPSEVVSGEKRQKRATAARQVDENG